jgi:NitT/TauT family transport system ATP-binding protein
VPGLGAGLQIKGVDFAYGATAILDDISLSVPPGQFVTLLGASGCGKSTLLRLLAGLALPSRGVLSWDHRPIAGPAVERGVVFQDYALFPWISVVDNVALAVGKSDRSLGKAERRERAKHYLRRVGLEAAIGKYPFELSGGMQQRAAIARALALGSPLLLMDEPFGALDPVNRARLQDVLLDLWEAKDGNAGKTVIFVTHDVDEALYLGDRVVILGSTPGRVIADLAVPFARHRQRQALYTDPEFHRLRETIGDLLNADTLRQLAEEPPARLPAERAPGNERAPSSKEFGAHEANPIIVF